MPIAQPLSRGSGLVLHPTSLPGPHGSGDFGAGAYHLVDWLEAGGQTLWQMLPLGGIGLGHSPYMSSSAFAGNVLLVDLYELERRGWLTAEELAPPDFPSRRVDYERVIPWRMERLARAAQRFAQRATAAEREELQAFRGAEATWLPDYALFMALAEAHEGRAWMDWPADLAWREPAALRAAREALRERIAFWEFAQWCFRRQWEYLHRYAGERGVRLVGDMPIFIALQSADVWAHPELFELGADGRPTVVAGVPPDCFSAEGQRWGNPLYHWSAHAEEGYAWWTERLRRTLALVDIVRIDHFRGFAGYWEIPATEPSAIHGRWRPGPGAALFEAAARALGQLPVIAEDLGLITPDVEALRRRLGFAGMRVLQFAWGDPAAGGEPRFLPHQHARDAVVYTGTHDNDTTVGWWASADEALRHHLREYLATDGRTIHWDLIRAACASVADLALFPMQDALGLDGTHRMNRPGTATGNWAWRFDWTMVPGDTAARLRRMAALYGRLPGADGLGAAT
ncbi:4-alpha-glucanotransferase [Azohydromonas caseinilytica]|uniref:4-alpha-glucanotransferase n=1 Tax=Azohydromonas caseinilytica TaxID=2728836 RepID=A0A848FAX6_9BURK|nr:4-alpha-glucanotransferase [Azohydromonas caseinilytica]NML16026.1 4-alpha-glucanotransferase [Azohydromonas caseinilytica]